MEIRRLFIDASYWVTLATVSLFLIWLGLQILIVLKRLWSQLTGGSNPQGGRSAGSGPSRIGPKD
jgi:hypothetical protein